MHYNINTEHNTSGNEMDHLMKIVNVHSHSIPYTGSEQYYQIILINKKARLSVDFVDYQFDGINILFLSPFQILNWQYLEDENITIIKFHSDFYCIEYHKKEVACNGILFNNIYEKPFFSIKKSLYNEITYNLNKLKTYSTSSSQHDLAISRTYLQLILAFCSKEKHKAQKVMPQKDAQNIAYSFKSMLEENFIQYRPVGFYAEKFALSSASFSKKVKMVFNKPPSKLIKERLILEAKRRLHLTFCSVKEIASDLGFTDEFYFSKFFKKEVGVSPKFFRDKTGISIVAKESM